jgi:beta-phosphoglucomutase
MAKPPVVAVLFDFNGVLLEDEPCHWRAFAEVLRPYGARIDRARYNTRYLVFDDRTALARMLLDERLDPGLLEPLLRRKRRVYERMARDLRIDPRAARLVRRLARRVPVAIVSGALRREIRTALVRARLNTVWSAIVSAEDVTRPKPFPDGYRLARRRMGISRRDSCLAIEDSPGGVRAARAAGCAVYGVATTFRPALLRRSGAGLVARRLSALRVESILGPRSRRPRGPASSRRRPIRRRS